jgi:hypothetical protein
MSDFSHLSKNATQAVSLPIDERIAYIQSPRWIGYSRAKFVLDRLEDLMIYPKKHRMPNLLLVGDTNNGKSMIVNRFASRHEAFDCPDEGTIHVPVILIECPPVPSEGRLYDKILARLFAPYQAKDKPEKKQAEVFKLINRIGTKTIVIDEIHNLLAGSAAEQRKFLNALRQLGNELQIPIVAAGTKDALRAINTDPQLGNRFEPLALQRWENDEEFLKLLASFEHMIPLKLPSHLTDDELAMKLLVMSEGLIGELSEILIRAAVYALRNSRENINKSILEDIGWISPSKRRKMAETAY